MTRIVILSLLLAGCCTGKRDVSIDAKVTSLCHAASLRVEIKENNQ